MTKFPFNCAWECWAMSWGLTCEHICNVKLHTVSSVLISNSSVQRKTAYLGIDSLLIQVYPTVYIKTLNRRRKIKILAPIYKLFSCLSIINIYDFDMCLYYWTCSYFDLDQLSAMLHMYIFTWSSQFHIPNYTDSLIFLLTIINSLFI